jgi:hypothetical protein
MIIPQGTRAFLRESTLLSREVALLCREFRCIPPKNTLLLEEVALLPRELFFLLVQVIFRNTLFVP